VIWRPVLAWTLGALVLTFTPDATEILSRMETVLRRVEPVQARVVREKADGEVLEELVVVVPAEPGSAQSLQTTLDLPYTLITLPLEEFTKTLSTIAAEESSVVLGRLDGKVCFILEGRDERLWISKGDFLPLKVEDLSENRLGTVYLYLDMVNLSEKVRYPSRTEVWREGELLLVERLVPATASTEGP
jgi:hypothetical protein